MFIWFSSFCSKNNNNFKLDASILMTDWKAVKDQQPRKWSLYHQCYKKTLKRRNRKPALLFLCHFCFVSWELTSLHRRGSFKYVVVGLFVVKKSSWQGKNSKSSLLVGYNANDETEALKTADGRSRHGASSLLLPARPGGVILWSQT